MLQQDTNFIIVSKDHLDQMDSLVSEDNPEGDDSGTPVDLPIFQPPDLTDIDQFEVFVVDHVMLMAFLILKSFFFCSSPETNKPQSGDASTVE